MNEGISESRSLIVSRRYFQINGASAVPKAIVRANTRIFSETINHTNLALISLSVELSTCDALLSGCPEKDEERVQKLIDQHCFLLTKITQISARTIPDLKVKAAAAELALKWDDDASSAGEGSFVELCKSINEDIRGFA
jgi:hypothetical protein